MKNTDKQAKIDDDFPNKMDVVDKKGKKNRNTRNHQSKISNHQIFILVIEKYIKEMCASVSKPKKHKCLN